VNGKQKKSKEPVELETDPAITEILKAGKCPNLADVFADENEIWTYEENEAYVRSGAIPDRFRRRSFAGDTTPKPAKAAKKEEDFYDDEFEEEEEVVPVQKTKVARKAVVEDEDDCPF
jgi:hypothetical protein